jgi:hypothetical protein
MTGKRVSDHTVIPFCSIYPAVLAHLMAKGTWVIHYASDDQTLSISGNPTARTYEELKNNFGNITLLTAEHVPEETAEYLASRCEMTEHRYNGHPRIREWVITK